MWVARRKWKVLDLRVEETFLYISIHPEGGGGGKSADEKHRKNRSSTCSSILLSSFLPLFLFLAFVSSRMVVSSSESSGVKQRRVPGRNLQTTREPRSFRYRTVSFILSRRIYILSLSREKDAWNFELWMCIFFLCIKRDTKCF